jgi:hypothetical protein
MLKGKKGVYIMVLINLAIWGYFGYTFYTEYFKSDDVEVAENKTNTVSKNISQDTTTYKLQLNYEDPFLKKEKQLAATNLVKPNNEPKKVVDKKIVKQPEEPKKPLPQIKYLGLVKNNSSGAITALVSINGQSHIIKANDNIEGIIFKNISSDNIIAQIGKEAITINK